MRRGPASAFRHRAARDDLARVVGVPGGDGPDRRGWLQPFGVWSRRGTDRACPTTGTVTSPVEMPYLAFLARLYHGVEATSCQAERNFSALANLIGDLRSNMLASKVERMMFIRLNKHMVDEVRDFDARKQRQKLG